MNRKNHCRRTENTHRHTRRAGGRRFLIASLLFVLAFGICFGIGTAQNELSVVSASEAEDSQFYYKSIRIEKGDTIWNIAERYSIGTGATVSEYIDNLADMNHMKTTELDSIIEGDYITVYYSAAIQDLARAE